MKTLMILIAGASLVTAGCSHPSPDDLLARAETARQAADKQADTLQNRSRLPEVFRPSLDLFTQVSNDYPGTPAGETATFMIAQILNSETRQDTLAVDAYKRFVRQYPESKQAGISMFMIGYIYNNELQWLDSAAAAYRRFLDRYPRHEMATAAQQELDHLGKSPDEWLSKNVASGPAPKAKTKAK